MLYILESRWLCIFHWLNLVSVFERIPPIYWCSLESNMKSLIYSRQLGFYKRFRSNLIDGSARSLVLSELLSHKNLNEQYTTMKEIIVKYKLDLHNEIRRLAVNCGKYKFELYMKFNPTLTRLHFNNIKSSTQRFVRLRLRSHSFLIETGRWRRTRRENRLCDHCILGDEMHIQL